MHPNRAFHWNEREEILAFATRQTFAHVFTASGEGLFLVHVPVAVNDGKIWFHVAKRNRIAGHLEGRGALISISGREGYQSANWYAAGDQVPTWHYEAVEIEGPVRRLTDAELVDLLDLLSGTMENRHSPEAPWTRAKMEPAKFQAMTRAIAGFEVDPVELRGTRKFNQYKSAEDLNATIEGQMRAGRADIVAAIEELTRDG